MRKPYLSFHLGIMMVSSQSMRFLLALSLVTCVAAAAYVVYQTNVALTPEEHSEVAFWSWEGFRKMETISYNTTIFPNATIANENISYGIFCDDNSGYECSIRIKYITNSYNIDNITIIIYNISDIIYTKEWTDLSWLPTSWESFSVSANSKYSIWIEISGSSDAIPESLSVIALDLNVHYP